MTVTIAFQKHRHILHVACRTYTLSLALSLLPSLVPVIVNPHPSAYVKFRKLLKRELGLTGFAFCMTIAVAGGRLIDELSKDGKISESERSPSTPRSTSTQSRRTFLANVVSSTVAIIIFASRNQRSARGTSSIPFTLSISRDTSPTLDLTLLILVRALDAHAQTYLQKYNSNAKESSPEAKNPSNRLFKFLIKEMDVILFWLASSRIMWCFFYEPNRLPRSYVKWIKSLADIDTRLITALQALREGTWKYGEPALKRDVLLEGMVRELGLDPCLGSPIHLPKYGGPLADQIWRKYNVHGRHGIGGLPCEVVHCGTTGSSCSGNATVRFGQAFIRALLIYAPVHILPGLIVRPRQLMKQPLPILLAILRSATFLSTFISSFWYTVCLVRSLVLARLFPKISHDFYDGPYGCILAGSLVCGLSIGIEKQKRRGEIALYVLPRAIRACLPKGWIALHNYTAQTIERLILMLSLASILTSAVRHPRSLRGLSKWTLNYIISEHPQ